MSPTPDPSGLPAGRALAFPYYWRVRTRLPERFGQPCAVLVRSRRMNSALVAFEDGTEVITSRNYVRLRAASLPREKP